MVSTMELSWIQRHALQVLIRQASARPVELCPPDVAANLFAYHLDRLVASGYVVKSGRGLYTLTSKGQKLAGTISTQTTAPAENIKTVIMLYAKTPAGYLLFRWSRQPYLGTVTPVYDRMSFGVSLDEAIKTALRDKLGVVVPVTYRATALVKIRHGEMQVSHMNALVYGVDVANLDLPTTTRNGEAFVGDISMMDGVRDFLMRIEDGDTAFESIWRY